MTDRFSLIALVATTLLAFSSCDSGTFQPSQDSKLVGQPAPPIEAEMLDGTRFSLPGKTGDSVVLLDFWATWCGPCIEELPILLGLAAEYQDRGVSLYAVNQGEDASTIREFLKARDWKLDVVLDPDRRFGRAYDVQGIPQLVVIDRKGMVHNVHVGYSPHIERILREELDKLVASRKQ